MRGGRGLLGSLAAALCAAAPLWSARAGAEPACGPSVSLEGDEALVRAVAAGLRARGVQPGAPPGCPAIRARLERRAGKGARVVLLGDGATIERQVSGPGAAVVFLESWARPDLSDPLLRSHTVIVTPPSPPPLRGPGSAAPAPWGPLPQLSVAAHGEVAVGTDGDAWLGAALRACVQIGRVCAGLLGRFAAGLPTATIGSVAFTRYGGELLVAVSLPFALGRVVLLPTVALGGGLLFLRTRVSGEELHEDDGGLRAELSLLGTVPLRFGLGLDFALGLGAAYPPGGDGIFYIPRRSGDDEYRVPVAAPTGPWGMLRAGLGLRWSAP